MKMLNVKPDPIIAFRIEIILMKNKRLKNQYNYVDGFWFILKLLAFGYVVLLVGRMLQGSPSQHLLANRYSSLCTRHPSDLFFENRPLDLSHYTCWQESSDSGIKKWKFGTCNTPNPAVKQKPSSEFENLYINVRQSNDFPNYWHEAQKIIKNNNLQMYQDKHTFRHAQYELLNILEVVVKILKNKNVGMRCSISRELSIVQIIASEFLQLHTESDLSRLPDFLYINYCFDYEAEKDSAREVVPDHGTLILLTQQTSAQLQLQRFFNIYNHFELDNNYPPSKDALIAEVIKRVLNPAQKGQAFQCDLWLNEARIITTQEGHCANEIFIKRPDRVESMRLLSLQNNPLILPLLQAFFEAHPEILEMYQQTVSNRMRLNI
jgi:hypothetical protein